MKDTLLYQDWWAFAPSLQAIMTHRRSLTVPGTRHMKKKKKRPAFPFRLSGKNKLALLHCGASMTPAIVVSIYLNKPLGKTNHLRFVEL